VVSLPAPFSCWAPFMLDCAKSYSNSMQKRALILLIAIVIVAYALFRISRRRATLSARPEMAGQTSATVVKSTTSHPAATYSQIDVRLLSKEQIADEVRRRDAADSKWEWKTPIRFYGRVVDEHLRPVPNAKIHFQWNDISPRGTSERETASDVQGLFSLTGVNGKGVLVRVTKEGYYTSVETNRMSYEFASPYEDSYYLPNPDEPVLFRLRTRGEAQQLVVRSAKTIIPYGEGKTTRIDLLNGDESPNGELIVTVSKPDGRQVHFPYDWRISISIPNGGLREHTDEFAFQAPEDGYLPGMDYSCHAENGMKGVALEKKLYFVFDQPRKYGNLNLRTDGNSRYVFIDYVLNPSGSRNLEDGRTRSSSGR
jgi:hypothetical protein